MFKRILRGIRNKRSFGGFGRKFPLAIEPKKPTTPYDPNSPYLPKGQYSVATKIVAIDGSGDFEDIQEAISSLPSGGGVVYVKEGIYTLSTALIMGSNTRLVGSGYSTEIKVPGSGGGISINSSNILIDSIRFTGAGANSEHLVFSGDSEIQIKSCWFEAPLGSPHKAAIHLTNCSKIIVSKCIFEIGNVGYSMMLTGCTDCIMSENIIDSSSYGGGFYLWEGNERIIIKNNIFNTPETAGVALQSVSGSENENNIITGNTFDSCANYIWAAVYLHSVYEINTLILGNVFTNNKADITDYGTNTQIAHNITA